MEGMIGNENAGEDELVQQHYYKEMRR